MINSEQLHGRLDAIRHGTQASLAVGAAVLAWNISKPPEAMAHVIDTQTAPILRTSALLHGATLNPKLTDIQTYSAAAPAESKSSDSSVPVTMSDVQRFVGIARIYVAKHHVATPEAPTPPCGGHEVFRLLPAYDPERNAVIGTTLDTTSDMRTQRPNGEWIDAAGRANPNCQIDLLNTKNPGAEGNAELCDDEFHEDEHQDGFKTKEPGRDPKGPFPDSDFNHDLDPDSLMYVYATRRHTTECNAATIDLQTQTIDTLADESRQLIPEYARAMANDKTPVDCKAVPNLQAICYISTNGVKIRGGRLVKFVNRHYKDGRPQLLQQPIKIPNNITRDFEAGKSIVRWLKKH